MLPISRSFSPTGPTQWFSLTLWITSLFPTLVYVVDPRRPQVFPVRRDSGLWLTPLRVGFSPKVSTDPGTLVEER